MEIYNLYNSVIQVALVALKKIEEVRGNFRLFMTAFLVALGIFAVVFVLQAIGLYTMAKKRNMTKKWLAFIPFANITLIGKLAGSCEFFGHKMKRAWLYAILAQSIGFVLCALYMLSVFYLFVYCGADIIIDESSGALSYIGAGALGRYACNYYNLSSFFISIVSLIQTVMMLILVMGLFKKYNAKSYVILSFVTLFIPLSKGIIIFILRNNKAIDFDAYMRAKREEYMRRAATYQNQYGGYNQNPYGGYNQNPYGGYHQNPYGAPQPPRPPKEPFSEFADQKEKEAEPFAEFSTSKREEPYRQTPPKNTENPSENGDSDDLFGE